MAELLSQILFLVLPFVIGAIGILLIKRRPKTSYVFLTLGDVALLLVGIDYIFPNTQINNIIIHPYGEVLGVVYLIMASILLFFLLRKRSTIGSSLLTIIGSIMFVLGFGSGIINNKYQELFMILGAVLVILGTLIKVNKVDRVNKNYLGPKGPKF